MDRLDSMSTLLAAVEAGSLSAASRKLGVPLSTVSRRVSELEAHLKTGLVTRTSRRLELTEAGHAYVAACKRILADIEEAEHTAAGEYRTPRGDLTITAPIVFGRLHLLPVALEFLKAYPEVDLRLMLADRFYNLVEEHVDIALRIGALPDSTLIAARLGAVRLMACASPAYLRDRGVPKKPQDLAAHDCITFGGFQSATSWSFGAGKTAIDMAVRSRVIVTTAEAAIDAASADVGVTRVLSYQAAAAIGTGKLAGVLESFEPPPLPVSLVHTGQSLLPLKVRAFLDFATPRLKARIEAHAPKPAKRSAKT